MVSKLGEVIYDERETGEQSKEISEEKREKSAHTVEMSELQRNRLIMRAITSEKLIS